MASVRDQNAGTVRDPAGRGPPPSARPVSRRSRSASASGRSRRQCQHKDRHLSRGESCERDPSSDRDGGTRLNGHCGIRVDLNCVPFIRFLPPKSSTPARSLSSPAGDKMGDTSPGGGSLSPSSASSTVSSSGSSSLIGAPRADDIMKTLDTFRRECKLNDLILQFSTGEIHCHRLVMAASSLYFRGMLCSNSGRISRREIIQMQGVDLSIMEYLVDYAYTGTVRGVTRDRVRKLKELASVFRYPEIGEACRQYLGRSLRENRNRSRTPTRTQTPIKQIYYPGSGRSSSAGSGFSGGSEGSSELYSPPPRMDPSPLIEFPKSSRGHESLRVEIPKRVPESPLSDHIETSPSPRANGTQELLETIANLTQELDRTHPTPDSGHSSGMAFLPERLTTIPRRTSGGGSSTGSSTEMASNISLDLFSMNDPSFALKMLREFNKIRKEGQLIDCVLRTATRDFPCHRVILQAHSASLGAICQRELDGSKTMDVFVKRINPDTLQKVLSYFYTGKIAISQRDVKSVYKASKRFGLDAVREACMVLDETIERGSCVLTDDSGISAATSPNYTLDSPGI